MKRILYLSFYFEPDLSACSFRNSPLAKELAKQLEGRAIIDVITTMPNRYSSFSVESAKEEWASNLSIHRVDLPKHKKGFLGQVNSFRYYYFSVKKLIKNKSYDLVFASSSKLFTAFLGYQISQKMKIPLYLDIRDIFTDTLNDVLKNKTLKKILLPLMRIIEKRIFCNAKHINLISGGFAAYFKQFKQINYSFYTNGIDDEFIHSEEYADSLPNSPIIITYAGNIGEGQGLHKIIPETAKLLGDKYYFRIIGDGGAKILLKDAIQQLQLTNVSLENPIKRTALIEVYKKSHFLFIHLNDYVAFEKVLPSKVFEIGAFPRPMIAGVNGYSRSFIQQHLTDCILVNPTDSKNLADKIQKYSFEIPQRNLFIQQFSRKRINTEMATSIASYL